MVNTCSEMDERQEHDLWVQTRRDEPITCLGALKGMFV